MNSRQLLASICRRKILRVLWKQGSMNIVDLIEKVNSTDDEVNEDLETLEKEGIVSEQQLGQVRYIKLERENQKTVILLHALKILDTKFTASKLPFDPGVINYE
jgi:DeoR/GlpR family transcriptional regulator of sugar metabolism